ncbi:glutamine--fructose-6-phosphate transaminase (isomerizing) [Amorphus orientalis]|uniref:Glutamine--fructose-6-phosphate aminotransferase [isomerizing] n=1 Tax=Amorphus orientalis TaxID=649198 RepID=A0AAE3VP70_9HYPH|nr:glutamine--fructose-6-phosphate transaminase (isomerizing) [Amorphus orientalis]MDQ0315661.1 glucosamine--fructose-6-phosphate aminotransferase (isomerizing) [Amorphus orientalis]
MCGIFGVLGSEPAAPRLLDALKRLEYRGYDSAGITTLDESGRLGRRRAAGKLRNLEKALDAEPLSGTTGIGHTRWATHGAPTVNNAHPHIAGRVAVVHNGIIENYRTLRDELMARGVKPESDTDTELVAHLVEAALAAGLSPKEAIGATLGKLQGAYALAILIEGEQDLIAAARAGSPLAIGLGEEGTYLGSDAIALAPFSDRLIYMEEGDWALLSRGGVEIFDEAGEPVERAIVATPVSISMAEKGNYRHFMAKEIHEQPEVLGHTFGHYLDLAQESLRFGAAEGIDFANATRMTIAACGTAYYAGLVARYWFERVAGLPIDIDVASEFRYREAPLTPGQPALFVSQSGETADTLASLRYCRAGGQKIASIVNVASSTIARESDVVLPTLAGPEIGVASTKAFTCQLAVLAALAVHAAHARGRLSEDEVREHVGILAEAPGYVADALRLEAGIERVARDLSHASNALYLGRGTNLPLALEGALKLKEISYIHAEGYAAGELKHGPIALIDEDMPVIVIAPHDAVFEKVASNIQEVAARGGRIILITDERGAEEVGTQSAETIVMPTVPPMIAPIAYAVPLQLLSYHAAVFAGTDVDQPRNLAKSVTVE